MKDTPIPVAGVDVSKQFSDMCILAPDNSVFRRAKIVHDLAGMQSSLSVLEETAVAFGAKPVVIMESTSHYHRLLWQFMTEAGYEVIVINPIQSGGLKNINVRKVKNDKVDAYKIAMLYRLKLLRPSNMPVRAIADLRALSRQHQDIGDDITPQVNRLTAILEKAFPGYDAIFSRKTAVGSLAVLEHYPTPRDILAAGEGKLMELLVKTSKRGVKFAADKTTKLIAAAKKAVWLGIRRDADALLIRSCVATIRTLLANVQAIDDAMRQILADNPHLDANIQLLQSIPGIGEFSAFVLLSEIGDISSFQKPNQLAAYFGLDPSVRQSGRFKGSKNKLSKRGSRYVRSILNMIAVNSVYTSSHGKVGNPVLAAYFEKKRAQKPHKVALCAVMHKIINIVFAVLRDQKPFELRTPEQHDLMLRTQHDCSAA
ncbi:MAG: IS110 family transposase [Oscillospiraceae bacterium]|nr:IS110 family transposase [Oscillospiraceae bacterium]